MTECKLMYHHVPGSGISKVRTVCETHGWEFPNGAHTTNTTVGCPVGVIERAVNAGIQRIEAKLAEIEKKLP